MWIYILITSAVLIVIGIILIASKHKTADEMDEMSGEEFEDYCAELLASNGYTIENMTKTSGDYGADIIISKDNEWIAVQCKRYNKPVGVRAVQEAYASMSYYNCKKCAVLTNNGFTAQAEKLAAENSVMLWDREFISAMRKGSVPIAENSASIFIFSRIINELPEGDFEILVDGKSKGIVPQNEKINIGISYGEHEIVIKSGRKKAKILIFADDNEKRCFVCGYVQKKLILAEIAG